MKKMKKRVVWMMIVCLAAFNTAIFAQQNDENRRARFEKFKSERVEFLTKTMNLTDDEKAAFLPLSEELQVKKFEANKTLRGEIRKIREAKKNNQEVSEADYKRVIDLGIQVKQSELQLDIEYLSKFLKVLSPEKVFLYQQAEQQFGRTVMERRGGAERGNAPERSGKGH
ncbi:hypothetical protein AGMMS50262_18410 [Bacteroidia bacterium]|nr:hypothetical protein AGMMS50262_18410 [Bacteroidia bacterium]